MTDMNRRDVLRYGAAAAVAGTAAVSAPHYLQTSAAAPPQSGGDGRDFAITYRGKRVIGAHSPDKKHRVTINGKELGIMSFPTLFTGPDGREYVAEGYVSALTHFEPVPIDDGAHRDGLRKIAERAVDILGDLELSDEAGNHHGVAAGR